MEKRILVTDSLYHDFRYFPTVEEAKEEIERLKPLDIYSVNHFIEILTEAKVGEHFIYESLLLLVKENSSEGVIWVETALDSLPKIHTLTLLREPVNGYHFEVKSYPRYPVYKKNDEVYYMMEDGRRCSINSLEISSDEYAESYKGHYFFLNYIELDDILKRAWHQNLNSFTQKLVSVTNSIKTVETSIQAFLSDFYLNLSDLSKYKNPNFLVDIDVVSLWVQDLSDLSWIANIARYGGILTENDKTIIQFKSHQLENFTEEFETVIPPEFISKGYFLETKVEYINGHYINNYIVNINRKMIEQTADIKSLASIIRQDILIILYRIQKEFSQRIELFSKPPSMGYVLQK